MRKLRSFKKAAGNIWKKARNFTGWLAMVIVILLAVGIGTLLITSVVANYQELGTKIVEGAQQVLTDHYCWTILFNVLIIIGMVLFFKYHDNKGAFNWEVISKAKLYGALAVILVILNVIFFLILVCSVKGSEMWSMLWATVTNPLVLTTVIASEVMIILVIILLVVLPNKDKKEDNSPGS